MEWVASLLVIATIVVLASMGRVRKPRVLPQVPGVHPDDVRELTALGERLVRERRAERACVLAERVRMIRARGVPVRAMTPSRVDDQWLLRFADGSVLVVQGRRSADPWLVVRQLVGGTVELSDHRYEQGRLLLTLDAGPRRPEFIALGEA
ncbi:hypothetical protein G7070_13595 [Propioniciclava coleopterorum]|uniref:Uncharacterized protein n=1 Tax=Propioniciclava coleopterorum TaxID=2714937 RepID=A0A6G7Y915_9ACTN|nr:hypothetical protein [Propioniciclava coleopterorum]QIK73107.1 hypothetical protein G7070_13595 [Propioniciclava coleopterorum]